MALLLLPAFFFTACEKSDLATTEEVDNYVVSAITDMETDARCGRHGCYEFVFPIVIVLPDGSEVSADSYEALRTAIKSWREANPDAEGRPQLAFPLDVLSEDGEVISVDSREALLELRKECRRQNPRPGHGPLAKACFRIQYPLTVALPNGTQVTFPGPQELKQAARRWCNAYPRNCKRPQLVFPVTVVFRDGTTVEAQSKQALKALKDACQDG